MAGGHVNIEIGVMHHVETPKHRQGMRHHVLQIDGKVEYHQAENDIAPGWHVQRGHTPQPCCWANSAALTATVPTVIRTTSVFRAVHVRLMAQWRALPCESWRRGRQTSHRAITANMPTKVPKRMSPSICPSPFSSYHSTEQSTDNEQRVPWGEITYYDSILGGVWYNVK